jgi:uncharacterized protein YbjT (DUF2867 family)
MAETILVTGATGLQGGGVARHLLKQGKPAVRCLTRCLDSEAAKTLKQLGADVVQADLDDPASLKSALNGCTGVFGVTNFWEAFLREYDQGVNLIDAAYEAGVEHLVLSTLPSARKISKGAVAVPHFETKYRMEEYTCQRSVPFTFVHVAFYFENFMNYFPPQRRAEGSYSFGFPLADARLGAVAVEDTGGVVTAIFERRAEFLGRTVEIIGDEMAAQEFAQIMSRVLGRRVTYNHIPRDTYAALGFPGARELADMFEFLRGHLPSRRAEIARCRQLYPPMQTFEPWLQANAGRFAALLAP